MRIKAVIRVLLTTILPLIVGMVVMVGAVAWLSGMFVEKIPPSETVRLIRTLTPEQQQNLEEVHEVEKEYIAEAVGTLRAETRTEIASRILAPISEVRGKAGDRVHKGDVLIVLDRRDMESRLDQAKSQLESAHVALSQAKKDYERDEQLFKERVVPAQKLEQTRTALNLAESKVKQLEQAVSEAEVNLSYTSIAAAQDGMIIDRLAEPGDIAQPGVPLLVLYDPDSLRLEVPVMENMAVKMSIGDTMTVHIDALNRDVEATVDEIVPQAEAASRSLLVKVALTDSEGLYEGMFGRLLIPSGVRRHLCLATDAIREVGQLDFVDVVAEDGLTLERRFITTGRLGMPGRVEVLSGLEAGDRVVLRHSSPR